MVFGHHFGRAADSLERGFGYGAAPHVLPQGRMFGQQPQKAPFLRGGKQRMNGVAMLTSLFVPWFVGVGVLWALSSELRYERPELAFSIYGCCAVVVIYLGCQSFWYTRHKWRTGIHEPTWYIFAFLTSLMYFVGYSVMACILFMTYTREGEMMKQLNTYSSVNPSHLNGQMMMDAGHIQFEDGNKLDLTKTMGFRNKHMFCVAPVIFADTAPESYDFWVVGKDCCSVPQKGHATDYHCGAWNRPIDEFVVNRIMDSEDNAFYRLAVQQAEAAYNIRSIHPLFFHWPATNEPSKALVRAKQASENRTKASATEAVAATEAAIQQRKAVAAAAAEAGAESRSGIAELHLCNQLRMAFAGGGFLLQLVLVVVAALAFSTMHQQA